ncbi:MAG: hypothetical protein JO326_03130 [Acetobacteraceae bacterium]|nr:hypothetical protein [Acetobacteraceae bacterium]
MIGRYSFTLHAPDERRLIGFDDAHGGDPVDPALCSDWRQLIIGAGAKATLAALTRFRTLPVWSRTF